MRRKSKKLKPLIQLLCRPHKKRRRQDEGYILVTVIGLLIATFVLFTAYSLATKVESTTTLASADSNSGFYAAEAGLNLRAEEIRQKFVGYNQPTGTSPTSSNACTSQSVGNQGTGDFACKNYQLAAGQSGSRQHTAFTYVVQKNNGQPTIGVIPRGQPFQNLNMQEYGYQIYSVAQKSGTSTPETILGMDVKSRVVPMFQFAAFYANDLEILPGPVLTLNGPIHTNGDLYLGAGDGLNVNGQITITKNKNLYNRRKDNPAVTGLPTQSGVVKVADASTPAQLKNILLATGVSPTPSAPWSAPLPAANLTSGWGSQIQVGVDPLTLPDTSFLSATGNYYNKADLRIQYTPNNLVPFAVTRIPDTANPLTTVSLSEGQLLSLMQPVLAKSDLASAGICQPVVPAVVPSSLTTLTSTQKQALVQALQVAIVSQNSPVAFSLVSTLLNNSLLSNVNSSLTTVISNLSSLSSLTSAQKGALTTLTPAQIAGLANQCFVSAPIQNISATVASKFYNNREGQNINILQLNIAGLAVWNRDGIAVNLSNGAVINNNSGTGFSTDQLLFTRASVDSGAPTNSFQKLGLAAVDTSEGGLVLYVTIDSTTYSSAVGNQSPYGFAITQGTQLLGLAQTSNTTNPTGLTIASDQAIYIQGDYNTINKQPAAVLADSINVLSKACVDLNNITINCGIAGIKNVAADTTINAAFLGGTDISSNSSYGGGLENYPRFHEDWSGKTLNYRGSFVSLSTPLHVSGARTSQIYSPPIRNWDYETDFNTSANLPPLSPRFVYLKQEQFVRTFG